MPLALGIVLATAGGASLALAMVTQRYALDPTAGVCPDDPDKVLLFGWPLARNLVWLIGIVLYGGANGEFGYDDTTMSAHHLNTRIHTRVILFTFY